MFTFLFGTLHFSRLPFRIVLEVISLHLAKVQLERRLELAWEGWSRQDDIRFGSFMTGMWPASNYPRKTDDYLKLFPVSQDAWQVNPQLAQNPGYPAFSK